MNDGPNDAGNQLGANQPSLPMKFYANDAQKTIARDLLFLWFQSLQMPSAPDTVRIEDYEIHRMDVGEWNDNEFRLSIEFSVKPSEGSLTNWWHGTGKRNWDWIRNKRRVFAVVESADQYQLQTVGGS